MKNLKKLLAVIVAVAILASFTVPVLAEDELTDAEKCEILGMLQGTGEGLTEDYLASTPTRYQAAIMSLRLKGLATDALDYTGEDNFDDAGLIWAQGQNMLSYLKANPNLGWQGVGDNNFEPLAEITAQAYYKILLVALGYVENVDFAWANVLPFAASKGLLAVADVDPFTVDDLATATIEALLADVADGSQKLIDALIAGGFVTEEDANAAGIYAIPVVPLAVVSVNAINTKQVAVTFNMAVDKASAETEANYTIAAVAPGDATLQADGKTVILTVAGENKMTNAGTAAVKVLKTVKDAGGTALAADYSETINVEDTTVPTLVGVKAVGAKTLELQFSEPVYDAEGVTTAIKTGQITVKSGIYTYFVTNAVADYAKGIITVTVGTTLIEGDLTIKVNAPGMTGDAIRDFAGLILIPKEVSYAYAVDTTVASATLTSVNKATKVAKITFSKPVYGANVKMYHSVNGVAAYGTAAVTKAEIDASTTWEFTFTNALPSGNLTFFLTNDGVAANQLSDLYGVKVPNQAFSYEVVADTTAPTVSTVTVNGNTSIDIKFSEAIDAAEAATAANFEILKPDSTALAFTASLQAADTARLTATLVDNTTYTITVKAMKDVAGNAMAAAYTTTKAVADNANPTVSSSYVVGTKDIYLVFSEAMNQDDLANKLNFLVDATGGGTFVALGTNDTITIISPTKIKITWIADTFVPTAGDVRIGAIRDVAGKKLGSDTTFSTDVTNIAGATLTVEKAELIAKNKIKLTFSGQLGTFDASEFSIRQEDNGATDKVYAFLAVESNTVNSSGKSEVVLVLDNNLRADAMDATPEAVEILVAAVPANTKTTENVVITGAGQTTIADKVAPTISKIVFVSALEIEVYFDEDLDANSIAAAGKNGFSVSGGTLTTALKHATDDSIIILTGTGFTANTDVIYTAGNITDNSTAKNALASVTKADALTVGAITITPATPANNTFAITDNFDASAAYATADVDMDTVTAGTQNTLTVNGVTYTVVVAGGTATVTAAGNSTATLAATTATIVVSKDGVTKNVIMTIPASTATVAGDDPVFN